jgi:hypothetical protein
MKKKISHRFILTALAGMICSNIFSQVLLVNNDFYIAPGAVVISKGSVHVSITGMIQNKGDMTIEGNLTNNGYINELTLGSFTLKKGGPGPGLINGNHTIGFYKVIFENENNFKVTTPLRIESSGIFLKGYLDYTAIDPLVFGPVAICNGVTATRHVKGTVAKEGVNDFIFPLGTGSKLKRASVSSITGGDASTVFIATYENGMPLSPDSLLSPLASLSNIEYWNIIRTGTGNANVQLEVVMSDYPGSAGSETFLQLARYNGSHWQSEGPYATLPFTHSVVSSGSLSDFSVFTIGSSMSSMRLFVKH